MKISAKTFCHIIVVSFFLSFMTAKGETDSESDWKKLSDEDNITTFVRKDRSSTSVAYRGEAIINAPVVKVVETVIDIEKFKDWMTQSVDMRVLKKISEVDWIIYDRVPVPFPFQDRDFVVSFRIDVDSKTKSVRLVEKSIDDPLYPPDKCCVRGNLIRSVYDVEPREEGKSYLKIEVEFDPKGNLPTWLVRAFLKDTARKTLTAIRTQVLKDVSARNEKLQELLK